MDSASIKATIDIVLDSKSRTRQIMQTNLPSGSAASLEDVIIGSCSTSIDINCDNIIDIIKQNLAAKMGGEYNHVEFLKLADMYKQLSECDPEDIKNLPSTTLVYYLAYVTNIPEDGLISDPKDPEGVGGGKIVITPYEPKSPAPYGGRQDPVERFCDPCFYHYLANPLAYDLSDSEQDLFDNLANGKSMDIPFPWRSNGFGAGDGTGNLSDVNGKTIYRKEYYKDPFGGLTKERQVPVLDSTKLGKGEFGEEDITVRYEGINQWLYTKYYGGTRYDLITLPGDESKKYIGLDLGAAFYVTVKLSTKTKKASSTTNFSGIADEYEYKFPVITISATGVFKFKVDQKIKDTVELVCCPEKLPAKQYSITLVKPVGSSGQFDNLQKSVNTIQKAMAGAYSDKAVIAIQSMDKDILCCEECYYCMFSLCADLGDLLKKIREAERNLRNQEPKNKGSREEALEGRPQCVAYDAQTGNPIPEQLLKRR